MIRLDRNHNPPNTQIDIPWVHDHNPYPQIQKDNSPSQRERSSSLSPPPDSPPKDSATTLNNNNNNNDHNDDDDDDKVKDNDTNPPPSPTKSPQPVQDLDQTSRVSTPLTELSPPPDDADGPPPDSIVVQMPEQSSGHDPTRPVQDLHQPDSASDSQNDANTQSFAAVDSTNKPALNDSPVDQPTSPSSSIPPSANPAAQNHVAPSTESSTGLPSPMPHSPAPSANQTNDVKVATILELNVDLLKVYQEFTARGVPQTDPVAGQYFARLQSNLTWLAAAADQSRQLNPGSLSLPMMDPPPAVDFLPMDRIQQFYAELPTIFAKEMARRQQAVLSAVSTATGTPIPSLKRDRTHDGVTPESALIKRRDTGESKPFGPSPLNNSNSLPNAFPMANGTPTNPAMAPNSANINLSLSGSPGMQNQLGVPSLGSPALGGTGNNNGITPNIMNTAEAQLAASNRERARQAQILAAQRQAQLAQQQQAQQQQGAPASQMSPSTGPGGNPMSNAGPGPGQGVAGHNQGMNAVAGPSGSNMNSMNAAIAQMAPNVQQAYRILQTPNHPLTQYMIQHVQGFQSLPLQTQIQKMLMAQSTIQQQRQEQQTQQALAQRMQMQNVSGGNGPGVMSPTSPNGASQFGSQMMNPASPGSNTSALPQNQNQQFNLGNLQGGGGGGNINLMSLPAHQRQLYLMQQQARASGGVGGATGGMGVGQTNQQAMIFAAQQQQERMRQEQQRMAAAAAQGLGSPGIGSPISAGSGGSDFPALRSNPSGGGIPGIARSARSPSDGTRSPMTPRVPTRGPSMGAEDYQRMMMQQQAQAQAQVQQASRMGGQIGGFGGHAQMGQGQWQQGQQQGMTGQGGGGYAGAGSPTTAQNWQPQGGGGNFPFPDSSQQHMSPQNASPAGDASNEFDLLNWTQ